MHNVINTTVALNTAGTYIYEMDSFQDEAGGYLYLTGTGNITIRLYGCSGSLSIISEKTSGNVIIDIYGFMGQLAFLMDSTGSRIVSLRGCIGDVINSGKINVLTLYSSLCRVVGTAPDTTYEEGAIKDIYTRLTTDGAITTKISNGIGAGQLSLSGGKVRALIYAGDVDTGAISASTIKADAVTKIQSGLASAEDLSTVDTVVDAIKAKTDVLEFTGGDVKATLDGEKVAAAVWNSLLEFIDETGAKRSAKAWIMLQGVFSTVKQRLKEYVS